ncbi:hypothetical protein BMF94_0497 [Rhodotorula taiwanensis]|uniref:Uncharacterized protein n=1 Tax=Rhodotorula taiwanensis TaxID=741276 RepID=A0A2S5BHR1_9BASI|nr:hypothetical protein BMF94_0497 [Rhodotorula taiwanensis]
MFSARSLARYAPRPAVRPQAVQQPHLISTSFAPIRSSTSAFSTSACAKSSGEGVGESKPIGGENPISARADGVKKAVKSVAEGAEGVAQQATGDEQSTFGREAKHPGPDPRNVHQQEQDKGRKAGLAHKGEQQGAI